MGVSGGVCGDMQAPCEARVLSRRRLLARIIRMGYNILSLDSGACCACWGALAAALAPQRRRGLDRWALIATPPPPYTQMYTLGWTHTCT